MRKKSLNDNAVVSDTESPSFLSDFDYINKNKIKLYSNMPCVLFHLKAICDNVSITIFRTAI